jgi:hypothetical protein
VHCVDIEDKPGSLHRFLSQSSLSGVDYLFFVAVSCGSSHGRLFVSAKDPKSFEAFVQEARIKTTIAAGFIMDGLDGVGAAANAIAGLAKKDITGIVGSAIVVDDRFRLLIVVDAQNADRAQKVLSE